MSMQEGRKKESDSEDDDDEEELLAAAARWAEGEKTESSSGDSDDDGESSSDDSSSSDADGSDEGGDGIHGDRSDDAAGAGRDRTKSTDKPKQRDNNSIKRKQTEKRTEEQASGGGTGQRLTPAPVAAPPVRLSLHVTQLPYDAAVSAVRTAFEVKGCTVTSVRFVYGRDNKKKGGGAATAKAFRGVAFVDVADEASFKSALKLDKTTLAGLPSRRVNVRPTRTKTELAAIVQRTKENLAAKNIDFDKSRSYENDKNKRRHFSRVSSGRSAGQGGGAAADSRAKKAADSRPEKRRRTDRGKQTETKMNDSRRGSEHTSSSGGKNITSKGHKGRSSPKSTNKKKEKLTKKERAKKAAIIRARAGRK